MKYIFIAHLSKRCWQFRILTMYTVKTNTAQYFLLLLPFYAFMHACFWCFITTNTIQNCFKDITQHLQFPPHLLFFRTFCVMKTSVIITNIFSRAIEINLSHNSPTTCVHFVFEGRCSGSGCWDSLFRLSSHWWISYHSSCLEFSAIFYKKQSCSLLSQNWYA